MKHAILITAYKNKEHLEKLIDFFDNDFFIYVHLDKKCKVIDSQALEELKQKVVFLSQEYNVNWGGFNHLKSILLLSRNALEEKSITRFHLISGADFPIKSVKYIKDFFKKNADKNYIDSFKLTSNDKMFMNRFNKYNLYDLFNKKNIIGKQIIKKSLWVQKKIDFKRQISENFPPLYNGSTWWSLTRDTLQYVIDYTSQKPEFLDRFKFTFCSEEMYIQSLIMNSPYRENVINNNLRYMDWKLRNGNVPANLDESDFDKLMKSPDIFARKFEYPVSESLLEQIILEIQ